MAPLAQRLIWSTSSAALKAHLEISGSAEDAQLERWFKAAVLQADLYLGVDWPDDAARKVRWTVDPGPAEDDVFVIEINGVVTSYAVGSGEDETAVAAALLAAMTTNLAAEPVTVSGADDYVDVEADTAGEMFSDQTRYHDDGGGTSGLTEEELRANASIPDDVVVGIYEYVGAVRLWHGARPGLQSVKTGQLSETYTKEGALRAGLAAAAMWWRGEAQEVLRLGSL